MSDFLPEPGDLWRDKDGDVWFASVRPGPAGGGEIHMSNAFDAHAPHDFIEHNYGPLTLVHREEVDS